MEENKIHFEKKEDLDSLLWTLAAKGKVVDKSMREELLASVEDEELREYVQLKCWEFNQTVQALYDNEGSTFYELQRVKRLLGQRTCEYNHALYEFKKYENKKMMKYREENRGDRKVAMRLLAMIKNPNSRVYQAYNLNFEKDAEILLGWFRIWRWRFPLELVSRIEQTRYGGRELTVFRRMVDQHNQQFTEMGPGM